VAGIIAAAANGVGTLGVAPHAQLVAVKVLSAATGSGSFGGIISGIVYAADINADVINMSLGAEFPRSGFIDDNGTPGDPSDDVKVGANEITGLLNAVSRATTYAYQHGTTIIVAAGNSGIDRDHDGSYYVVPADSATSSASPPPVRRLGAGPGHDAAGQPRQLFQLRSVAHQLRRARRRCHLPG